MRIIVTDAVTGSSPIKISNPFPLYKWKLISISAEVTGTSTADSSVTFTLVRHGAELVLINLSSSSTVLTNAASLEGFVQSSSVGSSETGNLVFPLYLGVNADFDEYINVAFVNNGSITWEIIFEEEL